MFIFIFSVKTHVVETCEFITKSGTFLPIFPRRGFFVQRAEGKSLETRVYSHGFLFSRRSYSFGLGITWTAQFPAKSIFFKSCLRQEASYDEGYNSGSKQSSKQKTGDIPKYACPPKNKEKKRKAHTRSIFTQVPTSAIKPLTRASSVSNMYDASALHSSVLPTLRDIHGRFNGVTRRGDVTVAGVSKR